MTAQNCDQINTCLDSCGHKVVLPPLRYIRNAIRAARYLTAEAVGAGVDFDGTVRAFAAMQKVQAGHINDEEQVILPEPGTEHLREDQLRAVTPSFEIRKRDLSMDSEEYVL